MKIIAILESSITSGGVFNQSLSAISRINRICKDKHEFEVHTFCTQNIAYLTDVLKIKCSLIKLSLIDKITLILGGNYFYQLLQRRFKFLSSFESGMIRNACDLVYFLDQSQKSKLLQRTNFITTAFDLCHRDIPEFPEVSWFGEFSIREDHFRNNISKALCIITESEELSKKISFRYSIDSDRCLAIPLSPSLFMQMESAKTKQDALLKFELTEGYYFYPAQFWPHKNHIRILQALVLLREQNFFPKVVFAGGDKGNKGYIERFVAKNKLDTQVQFLGFVPAEYIGGLYEGCLCVIMPTYFGPTNIPPLEAWLSKKPLIYSKHLINQVGHAAILVDPDDASSLAMGMLKITDAKERDRLVQAGVEKLFDINAQQNKAESSLSERIKTFSARRQNWE